VDTRTTNVLSICSGYGGIELGLRSVINSVTVCYLENEASACAILASRIRDGSLDDAPIWTDIRTFDPEPWRGLVSLVAGGFPCQPFSFAGKRLQSADERNLWPDVARIIDGVKPDRVFLENVTGILRYYHERIRPDLRAMGYSVAEGLFTASETGAPHRRERLFILAHAECRATERCGYEMERTPRENQTTEDKRERLWTDTRDGGNELAHSEGISSEWAIPIGDGRREPEAQVGNRGSELAHAEHEGSPRPRSRDESCIAQRSSFYTTTETSGSELAHAGVEGLEGIRPTRKAEYQERPEDVPLYPPGPSDQDGWAWLLDRWPELAPTVCKESPLQYEMSQIECQFCGSPDGPTQELPTEVLLRAIGNGVVPAVAALAFRTLSKALNQTLQSV